ncbi:MAG TPA: alpha/beta hydrolase [Candidatus Dormibacteraeota bacterium]|nr:alpha/beta hydrolase [Candidatus Dormibacteraeota bacterium]
MSEVVLPDWMGGADPGQIGFPLAVDREAYRKTAGVAYKDTPSGPLLLDAYRPAGEARHPLVVMIHGGGWTRGGRFEMGLSKWAGYLAAAGLAVVSIDYRLAPQTTYPDSFQDCLDAVDWAAAHADELGADATRIGLWGDSAGGHLVLLLATSQTNPAYRGPRMRTEAARLRAVASLYPPTDLRALDRAEQRAGIARIVRDFVGSEPDEAPQRWLDASPIEQVHTALPPIFILQGTRDLLVPASQATRFAERLVAAGAPHRLEIVEGGLHGFDRIAPDARALALIEDVREFLREKLC